MQLVPQTEAITWWPVDGGRPDADTNVLLKLAEGGSCEGFLDFDGDTPIWRDVGATRLPEGAVTHWADMPGDVLPELSGETIEQREAVCAAWHALPDDLRGDPRLTPLYRALGGPRMDQPSDADGVTGVDAVRLAAQALVEDFDCHAEPKQVHPRYVERLRAALRGLQ